MSPETGRWLTDANKVLDRVGEAGDEHRARLEEQLGADPVVVLIGAFSTGKSSLIKRLCVEHGVVPPDQLVIDAAPTTATTYDVLIDGVRWRDTPGLDSASAHHGRTAEAAAAYADVVLLALTPELFSPGDELGDYVQALAEGPFALDGALQAVLTRADEQGGSRGGDRFARWAATKAEEATRLLASVGLPDVPVHVVAADPRGRSALGLPDASAFDLTRSWDGVAGLDERVRRAASSPGARDAAIVRATAHAIDRTVRQLENELQQLTRAGDGGLAELQEVLDSLRAFENRQREALRDAMLRVVTDGPSRSLTARFRIAHEAWSASAARELEDIARQASVEVDAWSGLASVDDLDFELPDEPDDSDADPDGIPFEDLLRAKAAGIAGDANAKQKLEDDLRAWQEAKRRNKVREHYKGEGGFSSLREKREAEEALRRQQQREAAFAMFETGIDVMRERQRERARARAQADAAAADRELAESRAVILARKLFDGADVTGWKRRIIDVRVQVEERIEQLASEDRRPRLEDDLGRLRAVRATIPDLRNG